jgi:hypothetical protein
MMASAVCCSSAAPTPSCAPPAVPGSARAAVAREALIHGVLERPS